VVLAAAALAACTQSSNGSAGGSVGDSAGSAAGAKAAAPAVRNAAGGASGGASVGGAAVNASAPLVDGAARIRIAQMTVAIGRGGVPAAADRAETIALGAGGEVDADDRTSGRHATATLQLRVPPAGLTPVLGQLGRLGHEVSRQLSTTDVSEKVADVASRVGSARESIARLRTLYASAKKVADVIAIESELSTREADLESLEAQQRSLARQTAMATITLTLRTAVPAAAAPRHHTRGGFVGGLEHGWHGFVTAAGWVATAFGTLLPFLLVLAVLAVPGWLAWRRRRTVSA
jgi:hypothetical protein